MFALALRNVFRQRRRTLITMSTIVIGIAGLIVIGGFVKDIFYQLQEATIHSQIGHLQVYRQGYSENGKKQPFEYFLEQPDEVAEYLASLPTVKNAMKRINFSGLANNGRADLNIFGEGIEANKENELGSAMRIIAGRALTDDDEYGILIGKGVAANLNLQPGSYVSLMVSTEYGALNSIEFEVVGVFKSFAADYDNAAVRIPLYAAQELIDSDIVHAVVAELYQTRDTTSVVAQMKEKFGNSGYEIKAWDEIADFYAKAVTLYGSQLNVLQVIVLLMILLSVSNSVNMVVHEREGEFGTLMALGDGRNKVMKLIIMENAILGFGAGAAGALVGVLLALLIGSLQIEMPPLPNSQEGYIANVQLVPRVIAQSFAIGFVATLLASILPAYKVSRQPVVVALSKNI